MEDKTKQFDDAVDRMKDVLIVTEKKDEAKAKSGEDTIQEDLSKSLMKEELKVQKIKIQRKTKAYVKRDKSVNEKRANIKLPQLVIKKFDGTSLAWFLFWMKFQSNIRELETAPVGKSPYLKCLLIPRVRSFIDDLFFAFQSQSRTKSILICQYGKSIEITAAHVQCITPCLLFKIPVGKQVSLRT